MKKIVNPFNLGDNNSDNNWVEYLTLGSQLAITVTLMVFLGVWLDGKFDTTPVLTVVFSFLGVAGGMYNFIKRVINSDKKNE